MKFSAKKRLQSILGVRVTDRQFHAAHAARAKNAIAILKSTSATLSLDLLHPEPELVAHELKNQLDASHIRERHCVVALPPAWIMSQHSKLPPDLSAEDEASLLQIEAEKSFPCNPDELQIARSSQETTDGTYVTQLAIRQDQLTRLTTVLKTAGLKPVSFSLGLAALPGCVPAAGKGRITLLLEPKAATLLIAAGGGVAAFRTVESTIDSEAGENVVNGAALGRELRITFEQVPADLRREVTELWLLGDDKMGRQLEEILGDWARDSRLSIHRNPSAKLPVPEEMVEQIAERFLKEGPPQLEFLPPKPSRWAAMMSRYSSKRFATAGFAAAAVVAVLLLAFGWQEYRLWSLRSDWSGMAAQVKDLDNITARIREFRPWYDTTYRNLSIMRRVVECFPDNGTVSAKTFEIHGQGNISVSGTARDNASLLQTLDLLRKAKEVQGLKIEQIRGTPAQFTFTFRWNSNAGI